MRSLESAFLERLTLTPSHGSTLRALGEHRGEQELFDRSEQGIAGYRDALALIHESSEAQGD
jgi:hypothetical protein